MARTVWFAFALAVLMAPSALAGQRASDSDDDEAADGLARIRATLGAYQDVRAALADYAPPAGDYCMESGSGGMGYHYVNSDLLDDRLDVERPEILVYAPTGDGGRKLAGVEYIVPYTAWDRDQAPRILGRDLKRSDDLEIWYLHVWVWEENPNGEFADWNPVVKCSP